MKTENPEEISRRTFLGRCAAGLAGLVGAVLGGTGLGYFISPAFSKKEEDWVDLGPVGEVPKGTPRKIEFVERRRDAWATVERRSSAWVLTANGRDFIVFDPRCTHLGCPYRWDDVRKQFLCPCHTAVFNPDGRVVSGPPPRGLDRYPSKVVGGRLMILARPTKETV